MTDLSILMPVYNERATIDSAIEAALSADYPVDSFELVIVDDGSVDGTRVRLEQLADDPRVRVFYRDRNGGKGAAIRDAIGHARGKWAAVMDADLEYDPNDIALLLKPVLDGDAKVVFGARGFDSHSAFSFWYVVGNKGVTLVSNLLFNSWLSDIMTCHKLMPIETWRSLDLKSGGFAIEPEITGKLLARGHRVYEVPIRYRARSREEGKKLTAMDGIRTVATLVRVRMSERRR